MHPLRNTLRQVTKISLEVKLEQAEVSLILSWEQWAVVLMKTMIKE
jgi:hypothetical protein